MPGADAGLDALALVRAALEPEPARTRDEPRAFTWWPHGYALRVRAEPARADGAAVVAVETRLLAGVGGRGPEFAALAARNAREPGLSALRWDPETGEVSLRAAIVARPGDRGAAARRLSHAALLQAGEALLAADALLVALPGAAPLAPPASIAGLPVLAHAEAWRAYAAADRAESLARALERLALAAPAPWARLTRAGHGLDAELPCGGPHAAGGPGTGTALLRVSASQPHPRLGAGLVVVLVPPASAEPVAARAPATAALLNEGETREWTGADQLGGWCVHPSAGLSHAAFVPALALEEDTAEALAWQAGARARWAAAFLERMAALRAAAPGPSPGR